MTNFEPKILGILCNLCSYTGADLAGTARMKYPANMRSVRVMCSGRVDPGFIFDALRAGADGVLICGCHPGDCHYKRGNYAAQNRALLLAAMLEQFGIEKQRFRLDWVSAGEGERFARVVSEMYDGVAALGKLALHDPARAGGAKSEVRA